MNFGEALEQMKAGKQVARGGWLTPGSYVVLTPHTGMDGYAAFPGTVGGKAAEALHAAGKQSISLEARLDLKQANDRIVVGWTPWTVDLLAEDWSLVA